MSWRDVVPPADRAVYEAAGFGARQPPGTRPALLVVDVTYGFTGERYRSLLDSVREHRTSCGPAAWAAVAVIAGLVRAARAAGRPVIYTRGRVVGNAAALGGWAAKNRRAREDLATGERRHTIVEEIAPEPDDLVIEKDKPSAFFGTPLVAHLVNGAVDTLVVTGGTTSGCVRATVVDAFSYNFRVVVPEDAVFDRGTLSHQLSLFDLNEKYAQVLPADQAEVYLRTGSAGNSVNSRPPR